MEVKNYLDQSELSSNSTESFSHKSIKLGNHKRRPLRSLNNSYEKSTTRIGSDLMSSITRKLQINNIEVYSKKDAHRMSDPFHDKEQDNISCFPQVGFMGIGALEATKNTEYQILKKNRHKLGTSVVEYVHGKGDSKGCLQQQCPIKRKWIRNIIFYQKQLKNLLLLKEKINQCPAETIQQIDKDVHRTFAGNLLVKTRITLSQSGSEKYNLVENLRAVLRLYAVYDVAIGYVQGMNLMASAILLHMKEVNASFIYLKEVMNYGKLRHFYLQNFDYLKEQLRKLFHKQLKFHNIELYNLFVQNSIDHIIFVPYYLTLFASFVDIHYMHIVINQFMKQGIKFLHKFILVLLLFLKPTLMQDDGDEGPITKLGNNFIKNACIDWEQLLATTQFIDLI